MPRQRTTARIEAVERQMSLVAAAIASHVEMVAGERGIGIDTGASQTTLTILRVTLGAHESELDKLRLEMAALPDPQP